MSNILASLTNTASSFSTYEQALQVISNNTTNATTPGYANESVVLEANPFNSTAGGGGGVSLGATVSSRDAYAEYNVQLAQSDLSYSSSLSSQLQSIEPMFDLNSSSGSDSGIGGTLNDLFAAFSQLTTNPNNASYRQAVLNSAGNLASAFNTTANNLAAAQSSAVSQASSTVSTINSLIFQIQQINVEKRRNPAVNADPGVDAQLYSSLESLSKLVNFTSAQAADGTTSIYVGNQPLLIGTSQFSLQATSHSGQVQILDSTGNDLTSAVTGGKLGALVDTANKFIPNYQNQLDQLAQGVADTVNTQLQAGAYQDSSGTHSGVALFTYNSGSPARTLAVTSITQSQIAAGGTANPGGSDNALAISNLQSTSIASLGGFTFSQYYGNLGATLGTDSSNAQTNQTTQTQLLTQAQTLRSNISNVSLDEQAALMTEYQQAYDATSKLINVMAQLVQTALGIIPSTS